MCVALWRILGSARALLIIRIAIDAARSQGRVTKLPVRLHQERRHSRQRRQPPSPRSVHGGWPAGRLLPMLNKLNLCSFKMYLLHANRACKSSKKHGKQRKFDHTAVDFPWFLTLEPSFPKRQWLRRDCDNTPISRAYLSAHASNRPRNRAAMPKG
jgi:hypothetical protein